MSFLKSYVVFNRDQIDALPHEKEAQHEPPRIETPTGRRADLDLFFAATSATIRHGGDRACYRCAEDIVLLPAFERFRTVDSYYATLSHEVIHWTGHAMRLNRIGKIKRFGDEAYAREELVAELGAAFLCADLGVTAEPSHDHAAYLQSWLKVLKTDKRAIFAAAADAERATAFLKDLQPG